MVDTSLETPMSDGKQYHSAAALMASVTARAKAASATGGMSVDQLIRQFEFSRILARVYASDSADQWVLKGGVAALVRLRDGRMTNDIDFLHSIRADDLDRAVDQLENALALDLGDHFSFRIAEVDKIIGNTGRAGVAGRGISVAVESGKKRPNIQIDVVNESVVTQTPETTVAEALAVPGIIPPTVRLYPLVDHLADKVSATRTVFGSGRPSSRVRDMVDLALFALSQPVEGSALHTAISAEWAYRKFPDHPRFEPPEGWRRGWATTIRKVGVLAPYADFDEARALLARFLDPALAGEVDGFTWNPTTLTWEQK